MVVVEQMQSLVDSFGGQINPWGYLLLFVLCLLEASAFIGLFVPGESAQLLAGVLAQQGTLSVWACMGWAVLGAIVGDSLGYEVGRHFGPRLRRTWLGQRVGEERWAQAHDFVRRNGGRSIFFGRFVGVLRALVPAIAGDARMPYRQFFVWNVAGALVAAPAVVALGYAAGSSYHVVEQRLGQATYALLGVVIAFFVARHLRERRRSVQDRRADRHMSRH